LAFAFEVFSLSLSSLEEAVPQVFFRYTHSMTETGLFFRDDTQDDGRTLGKHIQKASIRLFCA
jgi:hypothetical protein